MILLWHTSAALIANYLWQAKELRWLLASLQDSLGSLKDGLEECVQLLKPDSTLVLSSLRSEIVKGWVRREGGSITKGVSSWFVVGLTVCYG